MEALVVNSFDMRFILLRLLLAEPITFSSLSWCSQPPYRRPSRGMFDITEVYILAFVRKRTTTTTTHYTGVDVS